MKTHINRRTFLKLASLFGISISNGAAFAGNLSITPQPGWIDVHHHILPPVYTLALSKIGITSAGGFPFPHWNAQVSIDAMDRNGVASAITSISSPGIYFGDIEFTKNLARQCNEFSASLIKDYHARFGGFAVLPLPDVKAALDELEYAMDVLKLDGVVLLTNVGGHYLGSSKFNDLYSALNQRKTVVYIHPTTPPNGKFPEMKYINPAIMEFVFDTTRAISNLIFNNTLERFPDIRFIFSHAGGTAPYIAQRIALLDHSRVFYKFDTIGNLKNLYYDTALSAASYALRSLQELVDSSHILFGSDFPFAPEALTGATISGLKNYDGFNEKELRAINRGNAQNLFWRFR